MVKIAREAFFRNQAEAAQRRRPSALRKISTALRRSVIENRGNLAAEQGWKVAHGVSRGLRYWQSEPRSGERKISSAAILSPDGALGDGAFFLKARAVGLPSSATPWLTACAPIAKI